MGGNRHKEEENYILGPFRIPHHWGLLKGKMAVLVASVYTQLNHFSKRAVANR